MARRARRRQRTQHNDLIVWTVLVVVIGGYVAHVINNHYWMQLALIVLLALAVSGLTFVTQWDTKCLVTFTATGFPCQNPTRGVIFGCRGQNHKWMKALARMGIRWQRVGPHPARGRTRESGRAGLGAGVRAGEVVTVRIEGDLRNTILFYTTVLASVCTILLFVDQAHRWLS